MTAPQRARITAGWTAVEDTTPGRAEARTAFEAFYESERSRAIALAAALCGNRWAAEELAHDAFVSAWQQWDRVGAYDAPSLWLRRAIIHRVISRARRTASEARALGRLATGRVARVPELAAEHEAFWREVRALPPRQAQAVTLFYLEDRSVEQIAIVLEVSPGAVRNALHSGRQRLRERLDQSGDPSGATASTGPTVPSAAPVERSHRASPADRPASADRPAPADRSARADRGASADRAGPADRPEPADRPARADRPEPAVRPASPDRSAPADHHASADRPATDDRSDPRTPEVSP